MEYADFKQACEEEREERSGSGRSGAAEESSNSKRGREATQLQRGRLKTSSIWSGRRMGEARMSGLARHELGTSAGPCFVKRVRPCSVKRVPSSKVPRLLQRGLCPCSLGQLSSILPPAGRQALPGGHGAKRGRLPASVPLRLA